MKASAPDPDRGIYSIAVAAELVGSGPRNLRQYEARGLLSPDRTSGGSGAIHYRRGYVDF
jgi:MerR family transcriptional regulator/heat shock protein HspR